MENINRPLVSVVCICYNQERFILESLQSVVNQTYPNIELIVIDNNSEDDSLRIITEFVNDHPDCNLIPNSENLGNCKAFNQGFTKSTGEYLIDLAGDDILESKRIEKGVSVLSENDKTRIHYSDAFLIDEKGQNLGLHSENTKTVVPGTDQPQGNVFIDVLSRYFICPPTIMGHRSVYEKLGGYDDSLLFEDFDFLVRASREFEFSYSPEPLVSRRMVAGSQSTLQYKRDSPYLESTYLVCKKAVDLINTDPEKNALHRRVKYEARQTIKLNEYLITQQYLSIMKQIGAPILDLQTYKWASKIRSIFG